MWIIYARALKRRSLLLERLKISQFSSWGQLQVRLQVGEVGEVELQLVISTSTWVLNLSWASSWSWIGVYSKANCNLTLKSSVHNIKSKLPANFHVQVAVICQFQFEDESIYLRTPITSWTHAATSLWRGTLGQLQFEVALLIELTVQPAAINNMVIQNELVRCGTIILILAPLGQRSTVQIYSKVLRVPKKDYYILHKITKQTGSQADTQHPLTRKTIVLMFSFVSLFPRSQNSDLLILLHFISVRADSPHLGQIMI